MCRITGFLDLTFKGEYNLNQIATSMRDTLIHGGPDDGGVYIEPKYGLALAHRRLSILDLSSSGHQPMEFENLVITYNGEVYNFEEIRQELESLGYTFRSNSDTEVILKAFHRWGIDAVHKFRGMFAFAIWDKTKKKLTLVRDRIGVKPLYWYFKDGLFMFSSELKAFHKHPKFKKKLNLEALSLYLQYGYITAPYTIFEKTYKLLPGHYLEIDLKGNIKLEPYWEIENFFIKGIEEKEKWLKRSEEELTEELEELLTESFKLRMVADVPVGMFLSGGIDSSLVAALLTKKGYKLKTFTIGFNEKEYNEAPYAKRVAEYLGTEHTELYCTPKEAFEVIPKLPELYDEPFGDSSVIPTYLVSKLAKTEVKVSLSADGGDEQFCGYTRYTFIFNRLLKLSRIPLKGVLIKLLETIGVNNIYRFYKTFNVILPKYTNARDKIAKLLNILKENDPLKQYDTSLKYFLPSELKNLLLEDIPITNQIFKLNSIKEKIDNINPLVLFMYYDIKTYLPDDILVKVDRATMGVALEGREPFLDHKILEWSSQLPIELKYKNGKTKYILRKILYKYLPKELVDRPKQGFGVPIYEWFRKDLKKLYKEFLNEESIKEAGIFNPKEVKNLLQNYLEGKGVNHYKLWLLFIFQMWRKKWFN
jgi:asparagine synthase (glutamine-hydrolysing)